MSWLFGPNDITFWFGTWDGLGQTIRGTAQPDAYIARLDANAEHAVVRTLVGRSDEQVAAFIVFDSNDLEAAVTELDARYLAGEVNGQIVQRRPVL